MFSRLRLSLFAALAALAFAGVLAGCQTPPGSTGTAPTFNQVATPTVKSVTAARATARTLLDAGKITLAREQAAQAKLDLIVEGVKTARALQPTDPAAAQAKLDDVDKQAAAVETNLKEGKAP